MKEKINEEIKNAMKAKDKFRLNVLKLLKSKLEHNNKDITQIIKSHYKSLAKSQEFFKDEALVELEKELDIIKEFLPKELSKEEYSALVDKHLELGNMGAIIKAIKEEVGDSFNGGTVSSLIKEKLNGWL